MKSQNYFLLSLLALAFPLLMAQSRSPEVPVGSVMAFATQTCPAGWIKANGQSLNRTGAYASLFAAIGTAHGYLNASTYYLPNYQGRFLRGVASGSATDPDRASRTAMNTNGLTGDNVGSVQGHAFQTHNHGVNDPGHSHVVYAGFNNNANGSSYFPPMANANDYNRSTSSSYTNISINNAAASGSTSQATANESRPVNAYVLYCIKY